MANRFHRPMTILMAEDDPEDRMLATEGFEESKLVNDLRFVKDGEELMDYLYRRGEYSEPENAPRPGLILLDLNMPRKDGREALEEIKADPNLRSIPVIVLTVSKVEEDIMRSYDSGANSYISKPVTFVGLVEVLRSLSVCWLEIVELPT